MRHSCLGACLLYAAAPSPPRPAPTPLPPPLIPTLQIPIVLLVAGGPEDCSATVPDPAPALEPAGTASSSRAHAGAAVPATGVTTGGSEVGPPAATATGSDDVPASTAATATSTAASAPRPDECSTPSPPLESESGMRLDSGSGEAGCHRPPRLRGPPGIAVLKSGVGVMVALLCWAVALLALSDLALRDLPEDLCLPRLVAAAGGGGAVAAVAAAG